MNFKEIIQNPIRKVTIYDGRLLDQMERFERHNRGGKTPTYFATHGHDDFIMCSIWAFYVLKNQNLENYYNINQFVYDKFGKQIPIFVTSTENVGDQETLQFIRELDNNFDLSDTNYEASVDQLQMDVNRNIQEITKKFAEYDSQAPIYEQEQDDRRDPYHDEDKFDFMGFNL